MTRKHFIFMLLGALIFLSAQGLFSCRVFKKNKIKADSTISRTEQKTQNWTSEIVTEFIVDPADSLLFSDLDSAFRYPAVFGLSPAESKKVFSVLKNKKPVGGTLTASSKAGKVLIRRIEKSSGQLTEQRQEQKEIKMVQDQKSREPNNTGNILTAISICTLLLVIIVILAISRLRAK